MRSIRIFRQKPTFRQKVRIVDCQPAIRLIKEIYGIRANIFPIATTVTGAISPYLVVVSDSNNLIIVIVLILPLPGLFGAERNHRANKVVALDGMRISDALYNEKTLAAAVDDKIVANARPVYIDSLDRQCIKIPVVAERPRNSKNRETLHLKLRHDGRVGESLLGLGGGLFVGGGGGGFGGGQVRDAGDLGRGLGRFGGGVAEGDHAGHFGIVRDRIGDGLDRDGGFAVFIGHRLARGVLLFGQVVHGQRGGVVAFGQDVFRQLKPDRHGQGRFDLLFGVFGVGVGEINIQRQHAVKRSAGLLGNLGGGFVQLRLLLLGFAGDQLRVQGGGHVFRKSAFGHVHMHVDLLVFRRLHGGDIGHGRRSGGLRRVRRFRRSGGRGGFGRRRRGGGLRGSVRRGRGGRGGRGFGGLGRRGRYVRFHGGVRRGGRRNRRLRRRFRCFGFRGGVRAGRRGLRGLCRRRRLDRLRLNRLHFYASGRRGGRLGFLRRPHVTGQGAGHAQHQQCAENTFFHGSFNSSLYRSCVCGGLRLLPGI